MSSVYRHAESMETPQIFSHRDESKEGWQFIILPSALPPSGAFGAIKMTYNIKRRKRRDIILASIASKVWESLPVPLSFPLMAFGVPTCDPGL